MKIIKYDTLKEWFNTLREKKLIKPAVSILIILIAVLFFGGNGESKGKSNLTLDFKSRENVENPSTLNVDNNVEKNNGEDYDNNVEKNNDEDYDNNVEKNNDEDSVNIDIEIVCDIGGAVMNPGIYTLPEGSRLNDLILLAGGLMEDADINKINRAEYIFDGEKVYVPRVNEEDIPVVFSGNGSGTDGKININTADLEELQLINGVGPAMAEKIINYRNEVGGFSSIDELMNISGIGEKTFDKMKENVTV